jgi:nucleotide-binding universal stress UspA family protein
MATTQIRRILVPVDCSSCSRAALQFAGGLATSLGAQIDVLFVAETADEAGLARARQELHEFVASTEIPKSAAVAERVESGDARERIVAIARRDGFDVIALGTHGRTGRPRMLAGSVAESVVRTSSCPVITVREAS